MTKRLVVAYGGSLEGCRGHRPALADRLDAELATRHARPRPGGDLEQVRDQARGRRRAPRACRRRPEGTGRRRSCCRRLTAGAFDAGPSRHCRRRVRSSPRTWCAVARMEGATRRGPRRAPALDRVRLERSDRGPGARAGRPRACADHRARTQRHRIDQNLWGRTVTMAAPADAWALAPADTFTRTQRAARRAPPSRPSSRSRSSAACRWRSTACRSTSTSWSRSSTPSPATTAWDGSTTRPAPSRALVEAPAAVVLSAAHRRAGVGQLRPRYAGARGQMAQAYAALIDDGRLAHARSRRPRRVHRGLGGSSVRRRSPAAVARRVPRGRPRSVGVALHRPSAFGA